MGASEKGFWGTIGTASALPSPARQVPGTKLFQWGIPFGVHCCCSKAQRGRVTCSRSHSKFDTGLLPPRPIFFSP